MERRTRVYPARKPFSRWISLFLLLLSAVLMVSGVVLPHSQDGLSILRIPQATTPPVDTPFDDAPASREITLPSSQWYALQLGAFEDAEAARKCADQFTARGAGGYIWQDARYRVLAAVYPLKEDAQQVRQQLDSQHGVDSYLYSVDLPALKLRLNGMQGQLDILEAAFVHASDLVVQLQRLSVLMDRQERSIDEILTETTQIGQLLQAVSQRLKQRFAVPRPACVEGLIASFDSFLSFALDMDSSTSSVRLGSALKRQTLSSLHALKQIYDTLGNT